jgi:hypothetical protein
MMFKKHIASHSSMFFPSCQLALLLLCSSAESPSQSRTDSVALVISNVKSLNLSAFMYQGGNVCRAHVVIRVSFSLPFA